MASVQWRNIFRTSPAIFAGFLALSACEEAPSSPVSAGQPAAPQRIEPVTGLPKSALVIVQGIPDPTEYGRIAYYIVYYAGKIVYYAGKLSLDQLRSGAARVCTYRGMRLTHVRDQAPEFPERSLPNTRHYLFHCA
jgi:hypothetical protein